MDFQHSHIVTAPIHDSVKKPLAAYRSAEFLSIEAPGIRLVLVHQLR